MSKLIGISGKIGCGKTTLARMLAERLGWCVLSFGGLIKDETSRVFGFPREWCDTPEGKRMRIHVPERLLAGALLPPVGTVRQALQYWGTDVCRTKDPDCWARLMAEQLELSATLRERGGLPDGVIIDDVRFVNEARMILARGGVLIRLDPYPGWEPGAGEEHASEVALDDWREWDIRIAPPKGKLGHLADFLGNAEVADYLCGSRTNGGTVVAQAVAHGAARAADRAAAARAEAVEARLRHEFESMLDDPLGPL